MRDCSRLLEKEKKEFESELKREIEKEIKEIKKEIKSEFKSKTEGSQKQAVQTLDAVSNALCKVADAAELIRNVHPLPEWQQAGDQVVQEVQHFMSVANFSDSIYERLREGAPAQAESGGEEPCKPGAPAAPAAAAAAAADAAAALTKEEAVVLRCMREAMEQQGVHLSSKEK
ncbi:peptidase family M3 domain containing protein, putative, partial [Eimeria tenella]